MMHPGDLATTGISHFPHKGQNMFEPKNYMKGMHTRNRLHVVPILCYLSEHMHALGSFILIVPTMWWSDNIELSYLQTQTSVCVCVWIVVVHPFCQRDGSPASARRAEHPLPTVGHHRYPSGTAHQLWRSQPLLGLAHQVIYNAHARYI